MAIKKRVPNKDRETREREKKYPSPKSTPDAEILADIGTLKYSLGLVVDSVMVEEKRGWFDPIKIDRTTITLSGGGVSAIVTFNSSSVDVTWTC